MRLGRIGFTWGRDVKGKMINILEIIGKGENRITKGVYVVGKEKLGRRRIIGKIMKRKRLMGKGRMGTRREFM